MTPGHPLGRESYEAVKCLLEGVGASLPQNF